MRQWLRVSICFLAVGCINTSVQRMDHATRPARSPDSVTVLVDKPQQPHTVIAVIESRGETVFDSFDDLRQEMIAEAAKLGGEALIFGPESTDSEFIFTGTAMIKSDRRNLTGEVIVYDRSERS
jgi:lipopolysaccharide export system protein LptA